MLHREQHLLFIVCVIDLLRLDDLFLVEDFDGVKPEVVFAPDCQMSDGKRESKGQEVGPTKMDPPEAARAEGTLKVEVGETVRALGSTLVWKDGFVYGTIFIYALATFAAFACVLRGD